jgi:phosphatidylserine decarboxylase
MGWFQHGSTIIVFAPEGFTLAENIRQGDSIRVGEPLMLLPQTDMPAAHVAPRHGRACPSHP